MQALAEMWGRSGQDFAAAQQGMFSDMVRRMAEAAGQQAGSAPTAGFFQPQELASGKKVVADGKVISETKRCVDLAMLEQELLSTACRGSFNGRRACGRRGVARICRQHVDQRTARLISKYVFAYQSFSQMVNLMPLLCDPRSYCILSFSYEHNKRCQENGQKYFQRQTLVTCSSLPAVPASRCGTPSWSCCRPRQGCGPGRSRTSPGTWWSTPTARSAG
jgi:hypothetical protein